MCRPIRILKITNPVGHTKMAKVNDRIDVQLLQLIKGLIGKRPVIPPRSQVSAIVGWPVTQVFKAQFLYEVEVITPPLIMEALVHLIHSSGRAVRKENGGVTVFYTRAEQKAVHLADY